MTEWLMIMLGLLSSGLLLCIVFQQIFFLRQIQKLIDKVMSRDFHEYQQATKPKEPRVQLPQDIPDDLRILQGFQT